MNSTLLLHPGGMSHGPAYKPPVSWYVISIALAVIYDAWTLVLRIGFADCIDYRKWRNHCILHITTIKQFVGFIYGVRLVLSCQIQDDLSLYYNPLLTKQFTWSVYIAYWFHISTYTSPHVWGCLHVFCSVCSIRSVYDPTLACLDGVIWNDWLWLLPCFA